jgi:hypothetical protein
MPSDDYADRRRRDWDDDGDDDPRRDYDDRRYRPDPRERVRAPGMALAIMGLVSSALTVGICVLFGFMLANDPNQDPDEVPLIIAFMVTFGGLSLVAFGVIAIGGWRMMRCESYGLAMTAAVLAIASIACIGLLSIVILPFGIWALVVLSDNDVKRAFRRRVDPSYDDYDDDGRWVRR